MVEHAPLTRGIGLPSLRGECSPGLEEDAPLMWGRILPLLVHCHDPRLPYCPMLNLISSGASLPISTFTTFFSSKSPVMTSRESDAAG